MKRLAARFALWLMFRFPEAAELVRLVFDLCRIKAGRLALRGSRRLAGLAERLLGPELHGL
jgi:hypothetical protein